MEVQLAEELIECIPDFKIGYIEYQDITVGESPQMLKGRLQFFQELLYFELQDKKIMDFPGILEWRQIFKKTGKIQIAIAILQKPYIEEFKSKTICKAFIVQLI